MARQLTGIAATHLWLRANPRLRTKRGARNATAIGLLLLFAILPKAYPQDSSTPSGERPTQSPSGKAPESLPQIIIRGKVLEKSVRTFISKISGVPAWSDDDPVALWRTAICPLVAGLPQKDGEIIFDRLTNALDSVRVPRGAAGCKPNFFIVVTPTPEAMLNAWARHNPSLFGDAVGSEHFIRTSRPVRIWYNAKWVDSDGAAPIPFDAVSTLVGLDGIPTFEHHGESLRQEFVAVPDLLSVIAVIDLSRVLGMDWRQVTDYVAMAGLTKVDLDANLGDTPTILRLFTTAGDPRPQGLSEWDKAFLTALYSTSQVSRHQRLQVEANMLRDVAPQ
jgi:hypothetical protein